ncbi:MAG: C69 family dipeptidase [Bacteroidaceae bacterium]|nr:C69 family dipeptidase [Bacteroidaceae bacterium]
MKTKKILLAALMALMAVGNAPACTNMIVGKKASVDGSTIVSYSADSYGMYGFLYHSKAGMHEKDEMVKIYEWDTGKYLGEIPQARQTYNVIGNMNEFQVTIGETTFGGREELVDHTGLIDYGSLIYLGLQRSRTAREAIKVMTDLVKEYGYYSSGESFSIADPNEVWIMEMIGKGPGVTGAVWVAVRIPDDCIAAHANQSRIHQFDLNDKENVMYSPDVISFAREKGYFTGLNKDFSFADAYNPLDFSGLRFCEARVWSYYNMFTDRGNEFLPYIQGETKTPMPLYVKPNRKLSVQDIQNAMRDHYEGTPLDISQDFGAGAYHTPYRLTPLSFSVNGERYFNERPISTQQSAWVFVAQMRDNLPDAIGGVFWFGTDDANMTVFVPIYCCTDLVPPCFDEHTDGAGAESFSFNSSFWVNNWIANMVYPRYDLMIDDVRATQTELENSFRAAQAGIEDTASRLAETDLAQAKAFLTNYSNMSAQSYISTWQKLAQYLVVKYNDTAVKRMGKRGLVGKDVDESKIVGRPGYPQQWAEEYVKQTGNRYKYPAE